MSKIRDYLLDIQRAIERIQIYVNMDKENFYKDIKTQDAVIRNFEIIGEAVKRLPQELTEKYTTIPWTDIAKFRDFLIHHYAKIDLDEIWMSYEKDIPPLSKTIEMMIMDLDLNQGDSL